MDHSSSCTLGEEVNRLKSELETVTLQRCQAAEQGLILLAQKEHMQQQLEEAEGRIESFRLELENSREVRFVNKRSIYCPSCTDSNNLHLQCLR